MSEQYRILRFLLVGILNTAFGYLIYAMLVMTEIPLMLAVFASMIAALLFNFVTYGRLVFDDLSRQNLPRFIIFYTLFGLVNYGGLIGLEIFGIKPVFGQAILLPVLAVLCYAGLRLFVFRASEHHARRT